jgi:hypothetical protein
MELKDIIDQPLTDPDKKRPVAITVICVLGFLGSTITFFLAFLDRAKQVGTWYPPFLGLSGIIHLAIFAGLWQMKKWAVYAYIAFAAIIQIVLISLGSWTIVGIVFPVIIIAITSSHFKKMD